MGAEQSLMSGETDSSSGKKRLSYQTAASTTLVTDDLFYVNQK